MVRLVAFLLLLAQMGMVALTTVHHHGPGDEHEDDCSICQVLHTPAPPGAPVPPLVLGILIRDLEVSTPPLWEPQLRPRPAACRGPPTPSPLDV